MAGEQRTSSFKVGLDVPWVTAWSSELDAKPEWRLCEYAGAVALWRPESQGVGQPMFKAIHEVRQRRAATHMLCQMCGKRTPSHDRWMFGKGGWLDSPDGAGKFWCTEDPPVHRACGNVASERCPFLKHSGKRMIAFPKVYTLRPAYNPDNSGRVLMLLTVPAREFSLKHFIDDLPPGHVVAP